MKFVPGNNKTSVEPPSVKMRCPHCSNKGIFSGVGIRDLAWHELRAFGGSSRNSAIYAGLRQCPDLECGAIIFVVVEGGSLIFSSPPEIIDFDSSNLPDGILASLKEAIVCHGAGAYRASALMIRRTLEELCADRGFDGKDLKIRLAALQKVAVIPSELLAAADELRLLGNDAAHIEAKSYDLIGKAEVEIAIELTKELLKAVYQYSALVAKLRALKKRED